MAFPVSPVEGQVYKDYQYNVLKNCWIKSENKVFTSISVINTPAVQVGSLGDYIVYSNENYKNTTQTFLNVQSGFDSSTGVFTAPESGSYIISWNGLIDTPISTSHGYFRFKKNGINISNYTHTSYGILKEYQNLSSCVAISLNKNDTLVVEITTLDQASVYASIYTGLSILKVK